MNKKKLLFVATRQFWPPSSGKEVTLFHNCKGLHEQYGYDIYLFCFADKNTDKELEKPSFIEDIRYANVPSIKKTAPRMMWQSIIRKRLPLQNVMFESKSIQKELVSYYNSVKPDAVIIDMVRLAGYMDVLPNDNIPHILIEDDLLAKRYQRQLNAKSNANISGYMSDSLSGGIKKLTNIEFIKKIVLKGEINRLNSYEASLVDKFDYITFISPIETREYNKIHQTTKAITLTMGADVEYCAEGIPGEHKNNSLSVVGNFAYGSNAASLLWINENILPKLSSDVKYYVIGKFPEELKAKLSNNNIISTGFVDDFRTTVKSTYVYLSPILYGTGIKTKVVEAMAMGMPVVTNSVGAEGLDVTNGKELFVEDDPEKMASIIRELLSDGELRRQVGLAGQEFVRKNHNWEHVYKVFGQMGL